MFRKKTESYSRTKICLSIMWIMLIIIISIINLNESRKNKQKFLGLQFPMVYQVYITTSKFYIYQHTILYFIQTKWNNIENALPHNL